MKKKNVTRVDELITIFTFTYINIPMYYTIIIYISLNLT